MLTDLERRLRVHVAPTALVDGSSFRCVEVLDDAVYSLPHLDEFFAFDVGVRLSRQTPLSCTACMSKMSSWWLIHGVKSTLNKVETLHTEKRSLAYIDQVRLSGRPLTIRGWKELGCEMEVHWRSRIGGLTCGIETRDESSCRDRQKCEQQGIHVTDNHGQYVQEKKKEQ